MTTKEAVKLARTIADLSPTERETILAFASELNGSAVKPAKRRAPKAAKPAAVVAEPEAAPRKRGRPRKDATAAPTAVAA